MAIFCISIGLFFNFLLNLNEQNNKEKLDQVCASLMKIGDCKLCHGNTPYDQDPEFNQYWDAAKLCDPAIVNPKNKTEMKK